MGRTFNGDEDRPEDNNAIAVISDQLWMSMFHLDPEVVGRTMKVNGRHVTIIASTAGIPRRPAAIRRDVLAPRGKHAGREQPRVGRIRPFRRDARGRITWQEARSIRKAAGNVGESFPGCEPEVQHRFVLRFWATHLPFSVKPFARRPGS